MGSITKARYDRMVNLRDQALKEAEEANAKTARYFERNHRLEDDNAGLKEQLSEYRKERQQLRSDLTDARRELQTQELANARLRGFLERVEVTDRDRKIAALVEAGASKSVLRTLAGSSVTVTGNKITSSAADYAADDSWRYR